MGFTLEYLSDGTVKGVLDLKNEDLNVPCRLEPKFSQDAVLSEPQVAQVSERNKSSDHRQPEAALA
jgi:hypothetical protein